MLFHVSSNGTSNVQYITEISTTIVIWWRTYSTEKHFDFVEAVRQIGCKMQTTSLLITVNHFFQTRFINRDNTFFQPFYLFCIDIHTENFGSHFSKASTCNQTNIAGPNDCYL